MKPTQEQIKLAAEAIANERGMRRGVPMISNILDVLPPKLKTEVMEDATAALEAAMTKPIDLRNLAQEIVPAYC